MENLKPVFTVNGKNYELKRTRALMVEFQKISNNNKMSDEDANKYLEIRETFEEMENDLSLLNDRLEKARIDYFDDPTNDEKKSKFEALKKLVKETQKPLVNGKSEEMQYLNKITKITLDNYEQAIIFAISEQHNMSLSSAKELWAEFVDEIGMSNASQWVFAIGDTLFNQEASENDFLSKKRVQQQQRIMARKKK